MTRLSYRGAIESKGYQEGCVAGLLVVLGLSVHVLCHRIRCPVLEPGSHSCRVSTRGPAASLFPLVRLQTSIAGRLSKSRSIRHSLPRSHSVEATQSKPRSRSHAVSKSVGRNRPVLPQLTVTINEGPEISKYYVTPESTRELGSTSRSTSRAASMPRLFFEVWLSIHAERAPLRLEIRAARSRGLLLSLFLVGAWGAVLGGWHQPPGDYPNQPCHRQLVTASMSCLRPIGPEEPTIVHMQ